MLSAITLPVQVEIANERGARVMPLDELLRTKREDILRIAKNYGAYNVRVFGSVARGEADSESDIDLLVNMESGRTLLTLVVLLMDFKILLFLIAVFVTHN